MTDFEIFVDSSANLTDEMIAESGITVISYDYIVDGKTYPCYEKGVPFYDTAKEFYTQLRAGKEIKTSLVNREKIIEAVTPCMKAGKDAVMVTISSQISGTFKQAEAAAEELSKLFPERKLFICDSLNSSLGEGLLAMNAARLKNLGESAETCAKWVSDHSLNMNSVFSVSDLKYLKRGGRISATLAIAGTILNIKPIIKADSTGRLVFAGCERGRRKAIAKLCENFSENVIEPANQVIGICHADCEDDALMLAEAVKALGAKQVVINMLDLCDGAHAGPGMLTLFFMGKSRKKETPEVARKRIFSRKSKEIKG